MRTPQDHLKSRPFRPGNVRQERVSEYFNFDGPDGLERAHRKVLRFELLAILSQMERGKEAMRWYRRLWRWLTSRRGSGPIQAVPPTQGEIDRGEVPPA